MNTDEIIEILKQHQSIEKVVLEKSRNVSDIWDNFVHIIYHNTRLEIAVWDEKLRTAMQEFQKSDSLDIVNKKGKLLKRFALFYKMTYGEVIPDNIMGIIGDCLQALIQNEMSIEYAIDFTDKFDWNDGDFGKKGSCWWGTYGGSLPTFEQGGGWCIRFYDENKYGIGRTWIYPHPDYDVLLGFNSYGIERGKVSKIIKKIFDSHGIELHYATCTIENKANSNIPYVNGGTGFVLHTNDIQPKDYYDLDLEPIELENIESCFHCGCRIDTEEDSYNYVHDDIYCEGCTNDLFSFCDKCGEYCNIDDVNSVRDSKSRYSYLCEDCAENAGFVLCSDCHEYSEYCQIAEDTGNAFCESCNPTWSCENCGNCYENTEECPDCPQDDEDEDNQETEQDENPKYESGYKNLIVESKEVYFTNGGDKLVNIYRFEDIPGLMVCKNTDWMVYHTESKLAAMSGISTFDLAIECLIKFGELTDWSLITANTLSLPLYADLRAGGLEIQRYIKAKM